MNGIANWHNYKLEEISLIIAGQSPKSDTYNFEKKGLPFYQGKADFGLHSPIPKVWCSEPLKIAEKDDILLSVRAPVGPTNMANEKCCIGRGLCAIRANENISIQYLLLYFKLFEKNISQMGSGSTFTAITIEDVKNLKVLLPPFEEQKRIVKIIEAKLNAVEKIKKTNTDQLVNCALLKDKLYDKIFSEYKNKYCDTKISKICEFIYGYSLSKQNRIKDIVPVYGSNGQIDYHNESITKGETIIVGRKGSIGEVHYSNIGCWVIDTAYYVKPLLEINIQYLYHLLKKLNLSGLNKASSIPGLNRDDVYKIDVNLPPLDEQKRIVNLLETKLTAVKKVENVVTEQSSYINALPSSILRKAFNGEY